MQQDRALALEQSELVKQFMKMREEKLRSESIDAREKLNAQMIKVDKAWLHMYFRILLLLLLLLL